LRATAQKVLGSCWCQTVVPERTMQQLKSRDWPGILDGSDWSVVRVAAPEIRSSRRERERRIYARLGVHSARASLFRDR
jgi:hypothetical protein